MNNADKVITMAPLQGIKVLDLSRILAGPWASQVLADLGAEVIKVERPGKGDDTRHFGPPFMRDDTGELTTESAYFMCANRGKESLSIDISTTSGQAEIKQLVAGVDILIENYKVGGLAKYGLDYASLSALNPALIYCSITGFGQSGPYAQRAGYDFMIQAVSGLMSITGQADEDGGEPTKIGVAITDIVTGLYAVIGIQAALLERQQTGLGKHIDMALLDCATALLANQASNYLVGGQMPERLGNRHPNIVPYQSFATKDGNIVIAVGNDNQFVALCNEISAPRLATDPRFSSNSARVKNRVQCVALLQSKLSHKSSAEWLAQLNAANIPCWPINSIQQALNDPQLAVRDMLQTCPHPLNSQLTLVGSPIQFVGENKRQTSPPPLLADSR